ncbi:MAG: hypothetical protein KAH20_06670 [Methylococcales bacterium]|nr:hypothetical protein [Methylococcales bacterium]
MNIRTFIYIQRIIFSFFLLSGLAVKADERVLQHGIDLLKQSDGDYVMIWSSSQSPINVQGNDEWEHDIYYSYLSPSSPTIEPQLLISAPEAQEPSSAAMTKNGNIMVSFEDGHNAENVLSQRYGVYNEDLSIAVKAYPNDVYDGGHSGHVAAVRNRFVVFYSEGWNDNKGFNGLGTGEDVHLSVYDEKGKFKMRRSVADDANEDWWPILAGSNKTAMLVWQRYVDGDEHVDLMMSVFNPYSGRFLKKQITLQHWVKYYTYSVKFLPKIKRFLVMGAYHNGGGFALLLDQYGNLKAGNYELPEIARESQSIVRPEGMRGQMVAQARSPNGMMTLHVKKNSISLINEVDDNYNWKYAGTDGLWKNNDEVYMVSLSTKKIVEKTFNALE